jgi:PKD repeat protein
MMPSASAGPSRPSANFSAAPRNGPEPLTVSFTDTSTSRDNITAWKWDFDDDGVVDSTEQNPIHVYIHDGKYTVELTVYDSGGNSDIEKKDKYVTVTDTKPRADFDATPASGLAPLQVSFTDTSTSYDKIVFWAWDFGDGKKSTEQNPIHKFMDSATFNVKLTVTDADGSANSITKQVLVLNNVPIADFYIVSSERPEINEEIAFVDKSSDPDGEVVSWLWSFGDDKTSSSQNATHKYQNPGTFDVSLTIKDNKGATDKAFRTVKIFVGNPPVTIDDYDGLWHNTGFTITLTANDDPGDVVETYYRINDGSVQNLGTQGQPLITTESANNKLEYWSVDFNGNEETHTIVSDIKLDKTKPTANAGLDQTVNEDSPMRFDGSASLDNINIVNYRWTFVNGTPRTLTGMNPTQTFSTPGTYTVTLTVTDALHSATDTVIITVNDITPPLVNIGDCEPVVDNAPVNLDATGSSDNVAIITYHWDFGDGNSENSTIPSAVHTYTKPGSYKVTLTATDGAGNFNATSTSVVVNRDTDGDLIADYIDADDDNDGMPDPWEIFRGLDPLDPLDAILDFDGDGINNLTEYQLKSDPNLHVLISPFTLLIILIATTGFLFSGVMFVRIRRKGNISEEKRKERVDS